MGIKITIPNTSSDVLTFGSGNTPTAAQIAGIDSGSSNGQLAIYTTASGTSTERVRVDSSGRTLIGLSSSVTSWGSGTGQQLQVTASGARYTGISSYAFSTTAAGDGAMLNLGRSRNATVGTLTATQSGDALGYLIFEGVNSSSSLAGGGYISVNQTAAAGASYLPAAMLFYTSNATNGAAERMRIDSNGNLLVGKTALNDTTAGAQIAGTGATYPGRICATVANSTNATEGIVVYSSTAGAYRFYVSMDGKVNATNTTIAAISDQRLKENIRDLDDGLSSIMALQPRKFDWKEGKGADIKNARGFIAQEFETVFPDLIDEWKDPAPEGEEPYKSVRADLIPTLVKAIQEQQAIIQTLTDRITALENK